MEKNLEILVSELNDLDRELVHIDGAMLKPSQCYRFETDPVHLMFNTNCPESLKQKVQAILDKHLPSDENSAPQ